MREFDDKTSWDGGRGEVLYTVSVVDAAGTHEKLKRALLTQLDRWNAIEIVRRAAEDAVVGANARVAWADHVLDKTVRAFANELLHDVGGDATKRGFSSYFSEPPNEVIRMGLEAEIDRCEEFDVVAEKVPLSKASEAKLDAVREAIKTGKVALARRRDAYNAQAQASLDIASWKESANATRVSVYVQLQAWALEHDDERAYADRFFPARSVAKRKGAKDDGEDTGGQKPPVNDPH